MDSKKNMLGYLTLISTLDSTKYQIQKNRGRMFESTTVAGFIPDSERKPYGKKQLHSTAPINTHLDKEFEMSDSLFLVQDLGICDKYTQTDKCCAEDLRFEYELMNEDLKEIREQVAELKNIVENVKSDLNADKYCVKKYKEDRRKMKKF